MTVSPSIANHKDMQSHNLISQTKIDDWRHARDVYIDDMNGWVDQIVDWRKKNDYDVGLYVVYEDLLDAVHGLNVVREYDFNEYISELTKEQKRLILSKLDTLIKAVEEREKDVGVA